MGQKYPYIFFPRYPVMVSVTSIALYTLLDKGAPYSVFAPFSASPLGAPRCLL